MADVVGLMKPCLQN